MRLARISLALATAASGLALTAAAPAVAAPTAHSQVSAHASAATMARWRTQRHEALGPGKYLETANWKRPAGVRIMQVKARCWGNDAKMKVNLVYQRRWAAGWITAKSGTWKCNGKYGYVRIHNAGHSTYYATFRMGKKHTVEYWVQYYK